MRIELRNLVVFGRHGYLEEERRLGQRFLVDLWVDVRGAAGWACVLAGALWFAREKGRQGQTQPQPSSATVPAPAMPAHTNGQAHAPSPTASSKRAHAATKKVQ